MEPALAGQEGRDPALGEKGRRPAAPGLEPAFVEPHQGSGGAQVARLRDLGEYVGEQPEAAGQLGEDRGAEAAGLLVLPAQAGVGAPAQGAVVAGVGPAALGAVREKARSKKPGGPQGPAEPGPLVAAGPHGAEGP